MRKTGKWAAILSAATALYAHSAVAQTVVAEAEDEGSIFLDQMTFTKTRKPLPAFDAPGMVTVLERDDIERAQPSSPDDVLRFVPGVEFNGGPRRTGETPSIRAMTVPMWPCCSTASDRSSVQPMMGGSSLIPSFSGALKSCAEVRPLSMAAAVLAASWSFGRRAEDFLEPGERAGARISAGYQDVNTEEFESLTAYAQSDSGGDVIANVTYRGSDAIDLGDGSKLINWGDEVIAGMLKAGADIGEDHYFEAACTAFFNEAEEPNNGQGVGGGDERSSYDTHSIFANANEPGRNSKARISYKLAF